MPERSFSLKNFQQQAASEALSTEALPTRDVAYGEGQRYAVADGKAVVEVYPAAAVARVTTSNARVELFRVPSYSLNEDRIIFAHEQGDGGSRLVVNAAGNVSLYPTVLRETTRRLPPREQSTGTASATPPEAERSEAGEPEPVTLTGRLGRDPWLNTEGESPVGGFPLAVNDAGRTTWHRVVVFDELAQEVWENRQIKKGRLVEVTGQTVVREETTDSGGVRKNREFHADSVTRLTATTKRPQPRSPEA